MHKYSGLTLCHIVFLNPNAVSFLFIYLCLSSPLVTYLGKIGTFYVIPGTVILIKLQSFLSSECMQYQCHIYCYNDNFPYLISMLGLVSNVFYMSLVLCLELHWIYDYFAGIQRMTQVLLVALLGHLITLLLLLGGS